MKKTTCPYCGDPLIEGYLLGDKLPIQWLPKDKKLFLGIWAKGGLPLSKRNLLKHPQVEGLRCVKCDKIIIDL